MQKNQMRNQGPKPQTPILPRLSLPILDLRALLLALAGMAQLVNPTP